MVAFIDAHRARVRRLLEKTLPLGFADEASIYGASRSRVDVRDYRVADDGPRPVKLNHWTGDYRAFSA